MSTYVIVEIKVSEHDKKSIVLILTEGCINIHDLITK